MTWATLSPFFQFFAWLLKKLGLDKPREPDLELLKLLQSKGFTFEEKQE